MASNENNRTGFNLVRWSVDHPYPVISFLIAVIGLAVYALLVTMPRRLMPYVESPLIGIVTTDQGLTPRQMEAYFSTPIEQRMVDVPNVRFIRSVSQQGFSMVTLQFPYGADMDKAGTEVQSMMAIVQADLPKTGPGQKPSWVLKVDPLNLPVLSLALTGDAAQGWTLPRLRELADNDILNRLKTSSPDVYSVSTFGGYRRELRVEVDRNKLSPLNLSILDVKNAIDGANLAAPAGILDNGSVEVQLTMNTLVQSAKDVSTIPLKAVGNKLVTIGDVAKVMDTVVEPRSGYSYLQGTKPISAIEINVMQNPDASSPRTIDEVMKTVKSIEQSYPGIHLQVAYNNANFVNVLFGNMAKELIVAVVLTALAVLFFLGDGKGTVIALTAIPCSLAIALLAMIPFGFSLNSSTLIGLLIAIGRLVDDAIIDIHAVERHMRMGKNAREATIDGISEVRRSVFAATLMLILALLPPIFSGGITQLMFVGLCWPIIFGLLGSYLVSVTLTSTLCARFMTAPGARKMTWFRRMALAPFDAFLTRLEGGYRRLIAWVLDHRFANFIRVAITVLGGCGFYYFIGSEMMPLGDVGQASMQLEMKPGQSYLATQNAVKRIEQIMAADAGRQGWLKKASVEIGEENGPGMDTGGAFYTGYEMNTVSTASAMLTFSDKDSGRPDIWALIDRIQAQALKDIPGIQHLSFKEMGSDVMATSEAPISLEVYGPKLSTLAEIGHGVLNIMEHGSVDPRTKKPDIAQPYLGWDLTRPVDELVVDAEKAAQNGLTPEQVANQAYYDLHGGSAADLYRTGIDRPAEIEIRNEAAQRQSLDSLDGLFVANPAGVQIPLTELAQLKPEMEPSAIEHDQLRRVISVNGYYRKTGRPSMDATNDVFMRSMGQLRFPPGYGIVPRGDMTEMMSSFHRMLVGLGLAVGLMYLVLVAQFGSFLQPLQMLLSLPLELSGAFFMLWLTHQSFSTVSILGIIVLSGMDIVTAILLIDRILDVRATGVPQNAAIAEACPERLRPILMTSMITIITMGEIAFFPRSGLDAYQPLGTVVVGGLAMGTILSLVDIPIMHTYVDDIEIWIRAKFGHRKP